MRNFLLVLLLSFSQNTVFASEWQVDTSAKNLVQFTSEVVVLTFDGVTDNIDGYLYWEGDSMFQTNSKLYFEVDLNTLETGMSKRDRDMRDVLETPKWQFTSFEGQISSVEKIDSTVTAFQIWTTGKMFIHGVSQEMEIPGIVTIETDGRMRVVCDFVVLLSDFNIEAPSLAAFVKVSNEIKLHLDFYLNESK